MLSIGAGLPPVPRSLAARIESGTFVEMSELSPEQLGTLSSETPDKGKSRRQVISNILEWIQCFGLYTAVVTRKKPEMIPDLIAYQTIIIEAHLEYEGDGWIGYDRCFRQRMVASSSEAWSHIDPTLWSMAFAGRAKSTRCKFCFSLTHTSPECSWSKDIPKHSSKGHTQPSPTQKICHVWNYSPSPTCTFPNCRFVHTCLICSKDPTATNTAHKALKCPRKAMFNRREPYRN